MTAAADDRFFRGGSVPGCGSGFRILLQEVRSRQKENQIKPTYSAWARHN